MVNRKTLEHDVYVLGTACDQLRAQLAEAQEGVLLWLKANAPGGWIDDMRNQFGHANARIATLEAALDGASSGLAKINTDLLASAWRWDCDHEPQSCDEIGCNGMYFRRIEETVQSLSASLHAAKGK